MTEATLAEWLVPNGASIEAGSPLYSMEMDKSTNEVDAPAGGRLKIVGEVGEVYPVGALIATIE